jgi:hypothetical protein
VCAQPQQEIEVKTPVPVELDDDTKLAMLLSMSCTDMQQWAMDNSLPDFKNVLEENQLDGEGMIDLDLSGWDSVLGLGLTQKKIRAKLFWTRFSKILPTSRNSAVSKPAAAPMPPVITPQRPKKKPKPVVKSRPLPASSLLKAHKDKSDGVVQARSDRSGDKVLLKLSKKRCNFFNSPQGCRCVHPLSLTHTCICIGISICMYIYVYALAHTYINAGGVTHVGSCTTHKAMGTGWRAERPRTSRRSRYDVYSAVKCGLVWCGVE